MRVFKYTWIVGLVVTAALILIPVWTFATAEAQPDNDPWAGVPTPAPHTSHADLMTGTLESG